MPTNIVSTAADVIPGLPGITPRELMLVAMLLGLDDYVQDLQAWHKVSDYDGAKGVLRDSWGGGAEGRGVPGEARKLTRAWTWAVSDWASSPGNRSGIVVPGLERCGLVKNSTIHSGRTRVPTASSTGAGFVFTPVAEMPPA